MIQKYSLGMHILSRHYGIPFVFSPRIPINLGLPDCPKIGQNVSNLSNLKITCPISKSSFYYHTDYTVITYTDNTTRLSFAKQCWSQWPLPKSLNKFHILAFLCEQVVSVLFMSDFVRFRFTFRISGNPV